jgi:hypothetical protein
MYTAVPSITQVRFFRELAAPEFIDTPVSFQGRSSAGASAHIKKYIRAELARSRVEEWPPDNNRRPEWPAAMRLGARG